MELLCGGCGRTTSVADGKLGGEVECTHCGRKIRIPAMGRHEAPRAEEEALRPLEPGDDMADEFLTKARLSLRKKLLMVCGSCGERLTVEQRLAGNVMRCPACGESIRIPELAYDEPIEALELMTEAGDRTEALDAGRRAPPEEEEPGAEGEPHRHRPAEAAMVAAAVEPASPSEAVLKGRSRRGPLPIVLAAVAATVLGLGVGYAIWGRHEATPPQPDKQPGTAGARGALPASAPKPSPKAQPGVKVVRAGLSALAGGGAVPAPLNQAFVRVTARMSAGDKPLAFRAAGGGVVLDIVKRKIPALGVAWGGEPLPQAGRDATITIAAAGTREETFVFLAPGDVAVGTLKIAGLGDAPLPELPKLRVLPPGAVAGTYVEQARHLKFAFSHPVMERLRLAPGQQLVITPAGDRFNVKIAAAGISGQATSGDDGLCAATLTDGRSRLDCRLRLVASPAAVILYLADEPFHQIVYGRK